MEKLTCGKAFTMKNISKERLYWRIP